MKLTPTLCLSCTLAVFVGACTTYESSPIDLPRDNQTWLHHSTQLSQRPITLEQAREIGLLMNPDLNKARLKHLSSQEVARQSGWWEDPSISWEIARVLHGNPKDPNMTGDLGLTIPLTGIPALTRQVAEQYSEADYWTLRQTELDFLTSLEENWHKLNIAQIRRSLIQRRLDEMALENASIEKLVKLGEAEFATYQLAAQRLHDAKRDLQDAQENEQSLRQEIAKLLGLHPHVVPLFRLESKSSTLSIPVTLPQPTPAQILDSPIIHASLAQYGVTESTLKMEIRKQFPDIELGPTFNREDGEKEVGGSIGFSIPLWNRNRQAIAEAQGARDTARQDTILLWRNRLHTASTLFQQQQMLKNHCEQEQQRLVQFSTNLETIEKLYSIGETTLPEVAEARQQLYESQMNLIERLETLIPVQSQLRFLTSTHTNIQ